MARYRNLYLLFSLNVNAKLLIFLIKNMIFLIKNISKFLDRKIKNKFNLEVQKS